jgi:hypothetical protein
VPECVRVEALSLSFWVEELSGKRDKRMLVSSARTWFDEQPPCTSDLGQQTEQTSDNNLIACEVVKYLRYMNSVMLPLPITCKPSDQFSLVKAERRDRDRDQDRDRDRDQNQNTTEDHVSMIYLDAKERETFATYRRHA